ncbi:MAG: MmgE/PrpD family protein [Burkholderiales bacterium]
MDQASSPNAAPDFAAEIAALLPALARLADRDAVALRLADTAACVLGAEQLADVSAGEESTITRIRRYGAWGAGPCSIWHDGSGASLDDAMLRNGVAARYLDYNDTYVGTAVTHPSDLIPALVALAEARGLGWQRLIESVTVAYEVMCRLAEVAKLTGRGFDGSSSLTPLGATAGASWLLGLDEKRTAEALCIAALDAGTLRAVRQGKLSDWKAVASARGAMKAVFAVRMVEAGCHSPEHVFEGKEGFCERIAGPLVIDAAGGARLPRTLLKKYPVQIFIQGLIELAALLRERVTVGDIASMQLGLAKPAVEMLGGPGSRQGKINRETADHTPGFAIGAVLKTGQLAHDDFDVLLQDEQVLSLMSKVEMLEDAGATAAYPREFNANLTAVLKDGKTIVVSQQGPAPMDAVSFARKLDELWPKERARSWPWRLSGEAPRFPG